MSWRYLATRLNGDGTETFLSNNVPFRSPSLTSTLSGADLMSGSIDPVVGNLVASDGLPLFKPWSTAIYAEADNQIRFGCIVDDLVPNGPSLGISGVGFTGYLNKTPYLLERSKVGVDPLDEARHMWEYVQSIKGSNINLDVDPTKSPVRIGKPLKKVSFTTKAGEDVEFDAGPYILAFYKTDDLGGEFEKLATDTPFDYYVTHEWDGEVPSHRLHLGYPRLGRRRQDLRFVIGENFAQVPSLQYSGEDYASEMLVLGSGEGRKMVQGHASRPTDRLRRVAVVADKSITSRKSADKRAEIELGYLLGDVDVSEIQVQDHPHAPLGSWSLGDEIYLQGKSAWAPDLNLWVRIVASTVEPEQSGTVKLTVIRSDKLTG